MTEAAHARLDLPLHLRERVQPLNDRPLQTDRRFVLCWLHHAIRDHENPALDTAIALANSIRKPVLVYQGLGGAHRFNADRHHAFILQGARDLQTALNSRSIAWACSVPKDPAQPSPLRALLQDACAFVTEDFPAPPFPKWARAHACRAECMAIAADSACIVPMRTVVKQHARAFRFRDAVKREWPSRIHADWPRTDPEIKPLRFDSEQYGFASTDLTSEDDESICAIAASCDVDHSIPPVRTTTGGSGAGYARWERFKEAGLRQYHKRRNNASDLGGVSWLSPYLHHGHVSPMRIAREAAQIGGDGADKFLDELLVWRELSHNFCLHEPGERLETLAALPAWAQQTLREHAADTRDSERSWESLARARSASALWNEAQRSLLHAGLLHNNVRMTWGKGIAAWARSPEEALHCLIDLNHRYALDGNNPNSYGGLLWSLGLFDRAFEPEKPVLGTVRGRDSDEHAQRLDPVKYARAVRTLAGVQPLRIGVIGGGIAGLSCARTLHDQGCDVTVLDKGRGPGGRTSTRRMNLDGDSFTFDHGSPSFTATDPRFGRYVRSWLDDGHATRWYPREAIWDGAQLHPTDAHAPVRLVGTPSMNALCAHLGADLDTRYGYEVNGCEPCPGGWAVSTKHGETLDFDAIVCALPARQAESCIHSAPCAHAYASIRYEPTWSLLCIFDSSPPPPADLIHFKQGPLRMLIRDSHKPGRGASRPAECWVAHASAEWSREHLELEKEAVADLLAHELRAVLGGPDGDFLHLAAHRWRYAQTTSTYQDRCASDHDARIALCGDGFGGNGIESAFLSGQAAAGRILAMRPDAAPEQEAREPSLFG